MTINLPAGSLKKGQNLWFVLNEWQYLIVKMCISVQICSIWGLFLEGYGNFWPLWPSMTPRMPQKESKNVTWQKIDTKFCIFKFSAFSCNFVKNGQLWPPYWPPFDPRELENSICMRNRPGYRAILEKNVYQKPLRNKSFENYHKGFGFRPVYFS